MVQLHTFQIKGFELLLLISVWGSSVHNSQGRKCLEGFISRKTLREKSALLGSFSQSQEKAQWIFPYMNFTCPTSIYSFRILAEVTGQGNRYPTLQIWRPRNDGTDFTKVLEVAHNLTPLNRSQSQYLRSITLARGVETGDVFGFYQPTVDKSQFVLYFQSESGRSSFRKSNQRNPLDSFRINDRNVDSSIQNFPLVGVRVENPECVSGFFTDDELLIKQKLLTNPSLANTQLTQHSQQRRLIPGLTFGCAGMVTSVMLTAKQTSGSVYPDVQIWRQDSANSSLYIRQNHIALSNPATGTFLNTQLFSILPPLEFEEGDVLGLFLPPVSSAAYFLQFVRSGQNGNFISSFPESYALLSLTNTNQYFDVNHSRAQLNYDLPMIMLEITADCGTLLPPRNGEVSASSTKANSSAVYNCSEGYILEGPRERICQPDNGEWSGDAPSCNAVDCGVPTTPPQGSVSYNSTTYLSLARFTCDYGFVMQGLSERVCTAQGIWSLSDPVCAGIECSSLAFPVNGRVQFEMAIEGTQVDSVAQYTCNTNYTLVGVSSRTCLENQAWTGESPICVADCPPPPTIPHGSMTLSGSEQQAALYTIATYTCDDGFMIHRQAGGKVNDRLICGETSEWMGRLPICEGVPSPTTPTMSITPTWITMLGTTAIVSVAPGSKEGPTQGSLNELHLTTETVPTQGPLIELHMIIVIIIAVLTVIILVMGITITVLCIKRSRYKAMEMSVTMANLNDTSIDNPVYEGDQRLSFNLWNPNLSSYGFQLDRSTPGSSRNSSVYEQPLHSGESDLTLHTREPSSPFTPRPSLHYEVSSIISPSLRPSELGYHEPEGREEFAHHYDTASNYRSSQYALPASPYEIPTPTMQNKMSSIYGSLPWGSYVPTEEQRRSTPSLVMHPHELKSQSQTSLVLDQLFFAEREIYWKPACDSAALYEQLARNRYREILREQIQITAHLGSGQFGTVDKGLWQSPVGVKEVAIKTLKTGSTEIDKVKFLQEAAINGQFQHKNVVKLHGVVTMGEPVMIVLELLANGDLRNYLIKSRPAPGELIPSDVPQLLLKFCTDIAAGMVYLSRKAFIHRDLAARNILVTESKTCKIGDFGLSRDLEDESYYISHGGHIPVKWTAPEAIHYKRYSTASDVWSFGCVMYEIWSLGHKPFGGCSNTDAINLIDCGYRLPPPPGCPREIYELMVYCWHSTSSLRPTFMEIHQKFHSDFPQLLFNRHTTNSTVIGNSLETSKDLYPDLQNLHLSENY